MSCYVDCHNAQHKLGCDAEAQHVILTEPLLDPAVEAQAVGRVHRIGQTKPTFVHRSVPHHAQTCACCVCHVQAIPLPQKVCHVLNTL